MAAMCVAGRAGIAADPREAWAVFAHNCHIFRGTPSRLWLDWVFAEAFDPDVQLDAATADLSDGEARALFARVTGATVTPADAELFRAHMLMMMAKMSLEDGLVLQIHPGSYRNHNPWLFDNYGQDKGADIPMATGDVAALRPLLARYGNNPDLTFIIFTLDETAYARELAPLAGRYPALKLGPPWWFHDSPEGMRLSRVASRCTQASGLGGSRTRA